MKQHVVDAVINFYTQLWTELKSGVVKYIVIFSDI